MLSQVEAALKVIDWGFHTCCHLISDQVCTKATHRSLSVSYSKTRAECGAYRSVLCPESCPGGMVRRTAGRRWARGASLSAFWQLRLTRPLSHPIDTDRTTVCQCWRVRGYVNTDAVRHVAVGVRAPTPRRPSSPPPRHPPRATHSFATATATATAQYALFYNNNSSNENKSSVLGKSIHQ